MSRNKYLRTDVGCTKCEWTGTRKDTSKPCAKCGAPVRALAQKGGRTFDIPKSANGKSKKANALPSGGGGGVWAAKNEEMGISGTSIFDPVLCELAYRWFCPPGGIVLDPFAGGSVRGILASKLGREYVGVDLSKRQIAANEAQMSLAEPERPPVWLAGDSTELAKVLKRAGFDKTRFDFVFSSPPYADLERYSDDPRDLSTWPYEKFRKGMTEIVQQCAAALADDRFACFVIGDARDAKGLLYGLPAHLVGICQSAGLELYNDAVLATAIASLPVRVRKQFTSARKLGRCHQYVQVYVKGDPLKAVRAIGEVEFGEPIAEPDEHGEQIVSLGGEF
jgi:hypothetical protein